MKHSLINKDDKNIHEHTFVDVPKKWENKRLNDKWDKFLRNKKPYSNSCRSSKEIGLV